MITKEFALQAYSDLIQLRRSEVLKKEKSSPGLIEIHHIIPVSCGGPDVSNNKIALYAKEHFMAHVYLWVIHHDDEFHDQTVCALNNMVKGTLKGMRRELRDFILKSEEYQKAREEFSKLVSSTIANKVSGQANGSYGKHWYKDPSTKECYMFFDGQQPKGWVRGRYQPQTEKVLKQLETFIRSIKGKKQIYNPTTGKKKYINPGNPIPDGFINESQPRTEAEKTKISRTLIAKQSGDPVYTQERVDKLRPMYSYYREFGFIMMKEKFQYPYTRANFLGNCRRYLSEYSPQQGKKINKDN